MYALCKVQGNLNYLHTYVSIVKERTFLACTYYLLGLFTFIFIAPYRKENYLKLLVFSFG